jgi:uncharacterized protein YdeI (YjbR/CyaY-like superfamily)
MEISKILCAANRDEWRRWLDRHHSMEKEIWLVYYKKHTGKTGVSYGVAVEEALCFGWIDSIIQRIDDERYARKFTPRKGSSRWSALNKRRVANLIKQGKMTGAGLATLNYSDAEDDYGRTAERARQDLIPPPFLEQMLERNPKARENFRLLAPSYRRNYIRWITAAKSDETRDKRLKEAIALLAENRKLGMK